MPTKTSRRSFKTDESPPLLAAAPLKLNLGCGQRPMDGFIGVDISPDCEADLICDLMTTPWHVVTRQADTWLAPPLWVTSDNHTGTLADNSVDEVFCSHFFEHVPGLLRMPFMNELWRVMKVGAIARFITPAPHSDRAIQDPTHAWPPVCGASYLYFNKGYRESDANKLSHYPLTCDFDFTYADMVDAPWSLRAQEARDFALRHYNNVAVDLHVHLTKRA